MSVGGTRFDLAIPSLLAAVLQPSLPLESLSEVQAVSRRQIDHAIRLFYL
jgi:hypothetical protein